MTEFISLLESADLIGRYRYVELACFAGLGALAPSCEPRLANYLSGASRAHGHRAGLLEEHLPVSVDLPHVAECTTSPDARIDEALALIVAERDAALLDALACFYEAMARSYTDRLSRCDNPADRALGRTLARVLADLERATQEARTLEGALGEFAPEGSARIAAVLAQTGGPFGPLRRAG